MTAGFATRLDDHHWRRWLVNPIDFIRSLQAVKQRYGRDTLEIIEIGFHPVLEKCCAVFDDYTYASSMFRGEKDIDWIVFQRRKLDPQPFAERLTAAVAGVNPRLDFDTSLAYQGLDSLGFTQLAADLEPFFPSLAPQDFYRYKTIRQLMDNFGAPKAAAPTDGARSVRNPVVIAGMSCRFPAAVETLPQFWEMLSAKADQVRTDEARGTSQAGYLNHKTTRFDHHYFNLSPAEARTMDPQQILALELTEMLWRDAGIDPKTLDPRQVGVYLGAWSQEYVGDRTSVYYPTGTNPSIIAARISYHYDLRGPSWVSNTACSSSLVALHYAAKDIEAGRVDYAIAGGVNMLLDESFSASMRNSGFLSQDDRCKAFDDAANGYVRAEGGGLVLLVNKSLVPAYYAELAGSAVNQNGGRSQVITAPHPEAQEELITDALEDAGIGPQEITYVECHGTGTKIGDPIEISALQNTVARDRSDTLYIGSVKTNIGHLESAAGIAGVLKTVAALNFGVLPPNLHFKQPNQFIDFDTYPLKVVTEATPIEHQAHAGISSYGFGGSNAHIIVKGAAASVRKPIEPVAVPFERQRSAALGPYLKLLDAPDATPAVDAPVAAGQADTVKHSVTRNEIDRLVSSLFHELTNIAEIDPDIELTEQGLDSMSGTELVSRLEEALDIEIAPDFIFEYPLREQFVDEIYVLTGAGLN